MLSEQSHADRASQPSHRDYLLASPRGSTAHVSLNALPSLLGALGISASKVADADATTTANAAACDFAAWGVADWASAARCAHRAHVAAMAADEGAAALGAEQDAAELNPLGDFGPRAQVEHT